MYGGRYWGGCNLDPTWTLRTLGLLGPSYCALVQVRSGDSPEHGRGWKNSTMKVFKTWWCMCQPRRWPSWCFSLVTPREYGRRFRSDVYLGRDPWNTNVGVLYETRSGRLLGGWLGSVGRLGTLQVACRSLLVLENIKHLIKETGKFIRLFRNPWTRLKHTLIVSVTRLVPKRPLVLSRLGCRLWHDRRTVHCLFRLGPGWT